MTWRPARPDDEVPRRVDQSLTHVVRSLGRSAPAFVTLSREWEGLVGPTLAAHARPLRIDGRVLTVAVDEPGWATELRFLAAELLARMAGFVGAGQVDSVKVVVRPK